MSFIRTGSNPERLYVFPTGTTVDFTWRGYRKTLQRAVCPEKDWIGLSRAYKANPHAKTLEFGSLKVQELLLSPKTGRIMSVDFASIDTIIKRIKQGQLWESKMRITITQGKKQKHIDLWYVTYRYLMQNAVSHLDFDAKKRAEKRQKTSVKPLN